MRQRRCDGVESRYLYQIINTVSSTLDLDRVLRAIVDLVSEAIDCHACWVYFVDPDGEGLVLRAVSDPYSALAGKLRFEPGEGLAGWVAAHNQPVFIPENAPDDPRAKVVPEAEEEKYQSLCAAPLQAKSGQVIGVIALHAQAPREFTRADSDFLVHAATLVAGAIENARLYEDTRRRLSMVEGLSDLARALSAASTLESLLPAVARRAQRLLDATCCDVLIADPEGHTLTPGAAWPQQHTAPPAAGRERTGDGAGAVGQGRRGRAQPPAGGGAVGRQRRHDRRGGADGGGRGAGRRAGAALRGRPADRRRAAARSRRRWPTRRRSRSRRCS